MASPPLRRRTRTETDQRTTHSANSPNAPPTNTRQAEPTNPHSASRQPYDEENSDDPRDGCPQPHECSGHGDLALDGFSSPVNATATKLKTTSSSSRSSPVISRPTFPPIQPDGARPVLRQDRDCRWSEIVSSARPSESTATARIDGSRSVPAVHKRSCKPNPLRNDEARVFARSTQPPRVSVDGPLTGASSRRCRTRH